MDNSIEAGMTPETMNKVEKWILATLESREQEAIWKRNMWLAIGMMVVLSLGMIFFGLVYVNWPAWFLCIGGWIFFFLVSQYYQRMWLRRVEHLNGMLR